VSGKEVLSEVRCSSQAGAGLKKVSGKTAQPKAKCMGRLCGRRELRNSLFLLLSFSVNQ
jgi:hypothetical protein